MGRGKSARLPGRSKSSSSPLLPFPLFFFLFASLQYEPDSDSDSDSDSDDDLPRPESSYDDSSNDDELVDDEDGGSPRPRRRRRLDEDGQVSCSSPSLFSLRPGAEIFSSTSWSTAQTSQPSQEGEVHSADPSILQRRNALRPERRWDDLHARFFARTGG